VNACSFEYGLNVLEGALPIGRQTDTIGFDEVTTRFEEVQSRASSAASLADSPIFAKIKSWLERRSGPSLREKPAWSAPTGSCSARPEVTEAFFVGGCCGSGAARPAASEEQSPTSLPRVTGRRRHGHPA
jgi:hypothetical protein